MESSLMPMVSAFFIFAPAGLLISLIQPEAWGIVPSLAITMFAGVMAVGWAITLEGFRRRWWLLIPLNIAPFVVPRYMFWGMYEAGLMNIGTEIPEIGRRIICAVLAVIMVSIGWTLMVRFLVKSEAKSARLRTELDLASRIHKSLVPPIDHRGQAVHVYGRSDASSEMGGDLIDIIVRAGSTDVFLADVSGHGVRAGVLMAMLKSAVRAALLEGNQGNAAPLDGVVSRLNRVLSQVAERDMFATFACLRVDEQRRVEYVLAGHLPILYVPASGRPSDLENECMPLGVDDGELFAARSIQAQPGDLFVILTDGLMETFDESGNQFGLARLRELALAARGTSLEEGYEAIVRAVRAHGKQTDDRSLLLVRIE